MIKTKGLGRGLSALLGDGDKKNSKDQNNNFSDFKTEKTPIHLLVPNQFQPRKNFEKNNLMN